MNLLFIFISNYYFLLFYYKLLLFLIYQFGNYKALKLYLALSYLKSIEFQENLIRFNTFNI